MSCLITGGMPTIGCRTGLGGVESVYIANYEVGLSYSFDALGVIDGIGRSIPSPGLTYAVLNIQYTEPLSATATTLPLHPQVGEIVTVEMNDPTYSVFNGTHSVTFTIRLSSNGRAIATTDRVPPTGFTPVVTSGIVRYQHQGLEITRLPDIPFYKINQPHEVASYNQVEYGSTENGTQYFEQITEITLTDLPSSREFIETLNIGVWVLLIKDMMGNYWISGYLQGARTDTSISGTGKLAGDLNGTIVTFKSKGPIAYKVAASAAIERITDGYSPPTDDLSP